jgi:N-acetylneuraminic acid mutarotase
LPSSGPWRRSSAEPVKPEGAPRTCSDRPAEPRPRRHAPSGRSAASSGAIRGSDDGRLHGELAARARREAGAIAIKGLSAAISGRRTEIEWWRGGAGQRSPGTLELEPRAFDARVRALEKDVRSPNGEIALGRPSPLREDDSRFYLLVVHELDEEHARLTTVEWPKRPFAEWWREVRGELQPEIEIEGSEFRLPTVPLAGCVDDTWTPTQDLLDPRYWHTAVWTGSEMIVWGGMESVGTIFDDGSRYDPATDTWTALPMTGAPSRRETHVAVWTGTEMVVWGATSDRTGGRYNPATDTWAPTSTVNAPAPRWDATVVWTGTEMIVWGGDGGNVLNSGGRYNPTTDTWASMPDAPLAPRAYHAAAWTGSEMVIWGGYNVHIGQLYADGARYSPATNSWTPMTGVNAPNARYWHTAVWSGSEVIVWGGINPPYDLSGGRYDPVTDTWTPTSLIDPPSLRWAHAAVWTGSEMIVQGGSGGVVAGGRYDPVTDTWTPTNPENSANHGQGITGVWTGSEMIIWGGLDDDFVFHFDGGRYDPQLDVWHPTGTMNVPTARGLHSGAWTGSEMMVWGGYSYGYPNTGALYDPATDSWRATSTVGAPAGRENATALWTGSEVLFWGGDPDGDPFDPGTGGLYNPATDGWRLTTTVNAATNRYGHTAVWTGSEMIVFGGIGTDTVAKRYRPATDTWVDATTVGAPGARDHHAAVWTGSEMILWGGFINDGTTPTGGRYDPLTDTWTPTNIPDSPATRMWPIGVWTGSEMIVWGGYDWLLFEELGDGARYDPATDGWTPTTLAGAPTPRISQGVWTGRELVLWGGENDSSGGRYDPATDSWRPTTLVSAPQVLWGGRWSTVWTGNRMIIWGGMGPTQKGGMYCAPQAAEIFADGFESGDTSAWSAVVP